MVSLSCCSASSCWQIAPDSYHSDCSVRLAILTGHVQNGTTPVYVLVASGGQTDLIGFDLDRIINYMSICRIYFWYISCIWSGIHLVFSDITMISLISLFVLRATREPCHLRSPPVDAWARPFELLPFVLPPAQKSAQLQGDARGTSMKIYLHNLLLYSISTRLYTVSQHISTDFNVFSD